MCSVCHGGTFDDDDDDDVQAREQMAASSCSFQLSNSLCQTEWDIFPWRCAPWQRRETVFVCVNTVHLLQSGASLFGEIHK